jgi:hypothetical protein
MSESNPTQKDVIDIKNNEDDEDIENNKHIEYSKYIYSMKDDYGIPLIKDEKKSIWFAALKDIIDAIRFISFKDGANYIDHICVIGNIIDNINGKINEIAFKHEDDEIVKMFVSTYNANIIIASEELKEKIFDIFAIDEWNKKTCDKYLNLLQAPLLLHENTKSEKDKCKEFYENIIKNRGINAYTMCVYGLIYITELLSIIVNSYIGCFCDYMIVYHSAKTHISDIDSLYSFCTLFRELIKIISSKFNDINSHFLSFSFENAQLIDNTFYNYNFDAPSSYDGIEAVLFYFCLTIRYYSKTSSKFQFKENKILRSPDDNDIRRMMPIKPIVKKSEKLHKIIPSLTN